jgi:hypothetical protein
VQQQQAYPYRPPVYGYFQPGSFLAGSLRVGRSSTWGVRWGSSKGLGSAVSLQQPVAFGPGVNPKPKKNKKKRPGQQVIQPFSAQGQSHHSLVGDQQVQVALGQGSHGQELFNQGNYMSQFVPQQPGVAVSIPQSHGFVQHGQFMPQFLTQQSVAPSPIPQQQQVKPQVQVGPPVPSEQPFVAPVESTVKVSGKGKKVWCWKCMVDTHAAKDCKVKHYCYVCDKRAHPTQRCPVLRAPRPPALVLGTGQLETYFTSLPVSVVFDDLVPSQSPVAREVISDDELPADVVAKQVARRCAVSQNWK